MKFVHRVPFYGIASPCGEITDYGLTIVVGKITCHGCLEKMVREGDAAAQRIIELDRIASEAEGSSSGINESAQADSSPAGRSELPPCPSCKQRDCYDNFCGMKWTDT